MSDRVGSVISESGMAENVGVAAETALPALFVRVISTFGFCGRLFLAPVVAHFAFGVELLS